jgi:hypothetical protein
MPPGRARLLLEEGDIAGACIWRPAFLRAIEEAVAGAAAG